MKYPFLNHARATEVIKRLSPWLTGGLMVLLVAVPFHAFFVTVIGAKFGNQLVWASWKEILQLLLVAGVIILSILRQNWRWLERGANKAVLVAILYGFVASAIGQGFGISWLAGVKTTILPLVLFLIVQPLTEYFTDRMLAKIILIPALVVAGLALLQFVLRPVEWLTSLGYNAMTILPFQGVHPGFDVARSFSTLGGPNQLGAYLIIPAIWLLARSLSEIRREQRVLSILGFALVLGGLAVSFSRSALLGLVAGSVVLVALYLPSKWRWLVAVLAALAGWLAWTLIVDVVSASGTALSSYFLRGTLQPTGDIVGGDSGHVQSIVKGIELLFAHPFGLGLGSAGPASYFRAEPLVTENWWLQIGLELGLPGLAAILTSWFLMFRHWHTHLDNFDRIMLASFCGLGVSALFLHTLADSTLGIIALSLAGLVYGRHWSDKYSEESV